MHGRFAWKLSPSSFLNRSRGKEVRDSSSVESLRNRYAWARNMSMRSELLFAAQRKIPNPFLLCAVTSARARQLIVARDGRAAVGEVVDYALREVAAGALEFKGVGPGCSHAALSVGAT